MSGIFESNLFKGHRVGYGSLGEVPEGAAPVSRLSAYRSRFPDLPTDRILEAKGATHFRTSVTGGATQSFTFYSEDGDEVFELTLTQRGAAPVEPQPGGERPALPARRQGDGLLPSAAEPSGGGQPRWLPWALVGGGVLVAGGIVWAATRRQPVAANRRRRRRRRTSRRKR